ncbi:MAG: hypothetical protein IPL53_18625 [Ignavibacteria bacterium]|nr:hypothetical protein [Ignavibacteria bacterium]
MKRIILILILFTAFVFISFDINDEGPMKKSQITISGNSSIVIDTKLMDVNSILTPYRTNGSFNRDPSTGNGAFEWPKEQEDCPVCIGYLARMCFWK